MLFSSKNKFLSIAQKNLRIGRAQSVVVGIGIFLCALGATSFGILPIQIAFITAAVGRVFAKLISIREVYESIEWSVIVLLGAMIPVGRAMEISGGSETIAQQFGDLIITGVPLILWFWPL